MTIEIKSVFRFSQYYHQGSGGWCAGFSVAVITHLLENLADGQAAPDPHLAATQSEEYLKIFRGSYQRHLGREAPGSSVFRQPVRNIQNSFDDFDFWFVGAPANRPKGHYTYSFDQPGIGLLRLQVDDIGDHKPCGKAFDSRWSVHSGSSNHAGMAVWHPSGNAFLFDPNCGGVFFRWKVSDAIEDFPAAIDHALLYLYANLDRLKGARCANVISAEILTTNIPFGKI